MPIRKIVTIEEEKCDGCGLCVEACHEGAIRILEGKARLVSDILCDGFGDCLGECPRGAITIIEREAEPYSEAAVKALNGRPPVSSLPTLGGCPSSAPRRLEPTASSNASQSASNRARPSALGNWPVQLHLAPVQAPFYAGADLLVAADCVPFALAGFHEELLGGRVLLVGCPKLDDSSAYGEKLAAILGLNDIRSVTLAVMEVPCCRGLVHLVKRAIEAAGKSGLLDASITTVSIRGEVLGTAAL